MKKYVIRSPSSVKTTPITFVYYQTDYQRKSVWCSDIDDAKLFDSYMQALDFGSKRYNIQGKWEVIEHTPNPTNPTLEAYNRAMRGV